MTLKYSFAARLLHWVMALGLWATFLLGKYISGLEGFSLETIQYISTHKAIGFLLLLLVFVRLGFRIYQSRPPLMLTKTQAIAAKVGHNLLYFLMILTPLLGLIGSSYSGFSVPLFSEHIVVPTFTVADLDISKTLFWYHGISAMALILLSLGHIAFALWHHFIERDNSLSKML